MSNNKILKRSLYFNIWFGYAWLVIIKTKHTLFLTYERILLLIIKNRTTFTVYNFYYTLLTGTLVLYTSTATRFPGTRFQTFQLRIPNFQLQMVTGWLLNSSLVLNFLRILFQCTGAGVTLRHRQHPLGKNGFPGTVCRLRILNFRFEWLQISY